MPRFWQSSRISGSSTGWAPGWSGSGCAGEPGRDRRYHRRVFRVSMIPEDTIEQIRDSADLVSLIGETVSLKRTGADYRGPCPFHGGTNRNFAVIPKKGRYYCF